MSPEDATFRSQLIEARRERDEARAELERRDRDYAKLADSEGWKAAALARATADRDKAVARANRLKRERNDARNALSAAIVRHNNAISALEKRLENYQLAFTHGIPDLVPVSETVTRGGTDPAFVRNRAAYYGVTEEIMRDFLEGGEAEVGLDSFDVPPPTPFDHPVDAHFPPCRVDG